MVLAQQGSGEPSRTPQGADREPTTKSSQSADLRGVIAKVHQSHDEEIDLGRLAVARADSDDVADFGKTLVNDHTKADLDLLALARDKKVGFTGEDNDADGRDESAGSGQMWKKLSQAKGAAFDREYANAMASMHTETLASLKTAEQRVSDPEMKEYLEDLSSTVEGHQKKAQDLVQKLTAERQGAVQDVGEPAPIDSSRASN
jgi:putative membrane protein